jgi:hypothetical protein
MEPDTRWYVLMWVVPADPSMDAWFEHEGPFETREEAVAAGRNARQTGDRFVRVICSQQVPTGGAWEDAEGIEE